jgi:hypothetical protein
MSNRRNDLLDEIQISETGGVNGCDKTDDPR